MDLQKMGTWDEWLATRVQPEPLPGETSVAITSADFVATSLLNSLYVDFGMAPLREGIADLFAEFEEATRGQMINMRQFGQEGRQLAIQASATPEGRVRLQMVHDGEQLGTDLPLEKALALIDLLVACVEAVTPKPDAG